MNLDFTQEQNLLRETASKFFANECPFDMVRELEESEIGYSPELWSKMAEMGWLGWLFPENYGGYGGEFTDIAIIQEEIGKAAYPSPFYSTIITCGLLIIEGGSEDIKKELIPQISDGSLIMAFAQEEKDGYYEEAGINMQAKPSGNDYILNGTKMFVMDANIANKIIVIAKSDDKNITLFLADAKDPGITCTKIPTIGMDNTCEVIFKDVKLPKTSIIGKVGQGWNILQKIFSKMAVAKSAEMLGGCKKSIDITAEYSKEREQYGKPLGGFQAIQHYMANMLVAYDTSFNYLYKVCWMIEEGLDSTGPSSAIKAQLNEKYKFITERGVQIHGGVGTSREFDIGLFYRRAKSMEYITGDSDYHYEIIAKSLGL